VEKVTKRQELLCKLDFQEGKTHSIKTLIIGNIFPKITLLFCTLPPSPNQFESCTLINTHHLVSRFITALIQTFKPHFSSLLLPFYGFSASGVCLFHFITSSHFFIFFQIYMHMQIT